MPALSNYKKICGQQTVSQLHTSSAHNSSWNNISGSLVGVSQSDDFSERSGLLYDKGHDELSPNFICLLASK